LLGVFLVLVLVIRLNAHLIFKDTGSHARSRAG
jgi:hypothetical protein